jgi:hypothetical protein
MLSLKNDVNISISNKYGKLKKLILLATLKPLPKRAGSGARIQISNPVYGSKDPDPYQILRLRNTGTGTW